MEIGIEVNVMKIKYKGLLIEIEHGLATVSKDDDKLVFSKRLGSFQTKNMTLTNFFKTVETYLK